MHPSPVKKKLVMIALSNVPMKCAVQLDAPGELCDRPATVLYCHADASLTPVCDDCLYRGGPDGRMLACLAHNIRLFIKTHAIRAATQKAN